MNAPLHLRAVRRCRPLWCALLLVLLGVGPAFAAHGDKWLRVSTPEVTVITPLDEKAATAWAGEFAQYVAALRDFFRNDRKLSALTVVVFAREREFRRYYPLLAPGGKPQEVGGFFSRNQSWAVVGLRAQVSEETRRTIFHEGVHWFLSTTDTQNPVWLEEGLAEVFSTFHAEKDQADWGRAIPEHVDLLSWTKPLPLERLLYTANSDVFGNDTLRTGLVYAESWAFVHFLIFGKHDIPRRAMVDYVDAISAGTNPDQAFRSAFQRSYAEMDRLLADYLAGGTYFVARRPLASVAPPSVQPATALEVDDALGRLAFAGHRWDLAVTHARAAIAVAPGDSRGHELLAIALKAKGDEAGAAAAFEAAIAHGTKDFQPYFESAVATHNMALKEHGDIAPADARKVANRYERAINLYPRFRASYENLAGVIGVADPWSEEDRKFLELGLRLFPDNAMIRLGLAQLMRRAGNFPEARGHLERALSARGGLSIDAHHFAHRLEIAWENEDISRRIDELADGGKFAEAIAFIDQKLTEGVDSTVRLRLKPVRENLQVACLTQQIKGALDAHNWDEARRALNELLTSDARPQIKAEARRTLSDLDRQKLGIE